MIGMRGWRPWADEFPSHDRHIARSVDSQPDLPSLEPDDRDADIVADIEFFHELAGQDEHFCLPIQCAQAYFQPTFSPDRPLRLAR
jgi:hypothetical protein